MTSETLSNSSRPREGRQGLGTWGRPMTRCEREVSTFTILRLLRLPSPFARQAILQAVRAINSPQSAPSLLKMLDDPNTDNALIAMQALIELAGGGAIDWVPPFPVFRENPNYYAHGVASGGKQNASHSNEAA